MTIKTLLNELCTTDAQARRGTLHTHLAKWFPARFHVEQRSWEAGAAASDTVNNLLTFGQEGGHLVIGAHYDAVPGSPGANDNAAAVVQLITAARQLQLQVEAGGPEPNVTFCLWDHEELFGTPCMGSRTYLEARPHALPKKAVVFDVSGRGEFFVSGGDPAGLAPGFLSRRTPSSDNIILMRQGIPATLISALPPEEWTVDRPATWQTMHTPSDSPDRVDPHTLEQGAALILDVVERFRAA